MTEEKDLYLQTGIVILFVLLLRCCYNHKIISLFPLILEELFERKNKKMYSNSNIYIGGGGGEGQISLPFPIWIEQENSSLWL